MKKRADGEGNIGFSESKQLWYCSLQIGTKQNGRPDRVYRYGKTQKEVKEKLTELVHKYGTLKLNKDITLNVLYPEWVFEFKDVSNKTRQNYLSIWKNHIEPYKLGKMKLSEITSFDIKRHFNQLARDGRSANRIQVVKHRLSSFFTDCSEYVVRNPVIGVPIPREAIAVSRSYSKIDKVVSNDEGAYNAFTVDEQRKLVNYLLENPLDTMNLLFLTFLGTGVRLGEALVFKWSSDVKDDYSTISITRNLQRVPIFENREIARYEMQELPPKSEAGKRESPLPDILSSLFRKAHLQHKLKARMDPYFEDNDLVFSNPLGEYIEGKMPLRKLREIEKKLDISPINIHGLRHTFATRLFEAGEEIEVVSALLGHASVDITREVYVHILNDRKKKVVEKINDILSV